jgi:hypothetical protein
MYRNGETDDELFEGVKKMEDSRQFSDELNKFTTFTYHLKSELNQIAMRKGIDNLKQNIVPTMVFCKELNKVIINDHGEELIFSRDPIHEIENNIFLITISCEQGINHLKVDRKFLSMSSEKFNHQLTHRFGTERKLRLSIGIEVDENNNIVEQGKETPSHFCVFPLIGSEAHLMPILINSPDFEPDSERESLFLNGPSLNKENQKISDSGINKMIIEESRKLFDHLMNYIYKKYDCLYLLLKGLREVPNVLKFFDADWFKNEVLKTYRGILCKYPIVDTKEGRQKLIDSENQPFIIFPYGKNINDQNDQNIQNQLYDLITFIFPSSKLPLKELNAKWISFLWKKYKLYSISDLCEFISSKLNIANLKFLNQMDPFEWINNFLE